MSRKTAVLEQSQKIGDIIELNDLLELILNNVYSGIIFCDSESRILFMNQVYADLLGTDRAQGRRQAHHRFLPVVAAPRGARKGPGRAG